MVNYKLRDWLFSRQRYWGEPFPIVWRHGPDGQPWHEALPETQLPLVPPDLTDFKPTGAGEPPLARATGWVRLPDGSERETNTMPQWAGSCWYYLRYLDARNERALCDPAVERYWMGARGGATSPPLSGRRGPAPGVDLYVGGTEHAVLHLLYARFWHKALHDLGLASTPEPFFKLVNQGLILGEMEFTVFLDADDQPCSAEQVRDVAEEATPEGPRLVGWHKHINAKLLGRRISDDDVLKSGDGFCLKAKPAIRVDARSFKMSKSRGNVINPDAVLAEYGADAFRLYEMFLGPLEMVKPWSTKGVEGVYRFLGRVWRLFVEEASETELEQHLTLEPRRGAQWLGKVRLHSSLRPEAPQPAQLKALHACIKKVTEDLDGLRFNTAIAALMIFVNEAITWEVKPVAVLRDFLVLLQPFAPHLAEELFAKLAPGEAGALGSMAYLAWPAYQAALLQEATLEIPVQVNGKLRGRIQVAAAAGAADYERLALACETVGPFVTGKTVRKVIVVPKKLVNLVLG